MTKPKYELNEKDVVVHLFQQSKGGFSGQYITGVEVLHKPTGVVKSCATERSEFRNREEALRLLQEALDNGEGQYSSFQKRVRPWLMECFGPMISADKQERNHRFLEESLELVQAGGCTASEAHQLVDYVFGRPVGELGQEVGGTMVTLAALCLAHGADMHAEAERELARISVPDTVAKIRAKQAAKPKHSPLPEAASHYIQGNSYGITDEQYLISLADHYVDSPVQEIREHRDRLMAIASKLSAPAVAPTNDARLRHSLWLALEHTVHRYLLANTHGRWDGAEKATRHIELCNHYVATFNGGTRDDAMTDHEAAWKAVHEGTQALTDHMDEVIGFPIDSRPDYEALAPKFFAEFHKLAVAALAAPTAPQAGAPTAPTTEQSSEVAAPWRSAVLDLIDDCPGLSMEQDQWLSRRVKELDFPSAAQPQAGALAVTDAADADTNPTNRHLFKVMCTHFGIELDKDKVADALRKITPPQAGAESLPMTVIDESQWEPCSPEWISRGGDCAAAPRVWNAATCNHWHPKAGAESYEHQYAVMEAHRNAKADGYFKARHEMLDTLANRRIFEAGFERGWDESATAALRASGAEPLAAPAAPTEPDHLPDVTKMVAAPMSAQPRAYCEPCQQAGMSNCSDFVNCGNAKCVTCHQVLTNELKV